MACYELCNDILLILMTNRYLKDKSIIKIAEKFDECIVDLLKYTPKYHLEIAIYFTAMIEMMLAFSIEDEEYEAATNLRNFKDLYFQNLIPYNDEERDN